MPAVETEERAEPIVAKQKPKYRITIYDAWCKKCGLCAEFCPKGVLTSNQLGCPEATNSEKCIGCAQCVLHCPDFAISVSAEERKDDTTEG